MSTPKPVSVLVFDVNETLLDITTLSPLFGRVFGDEGVLREWFAQLVLYSQTMTLAHRYTPFGELGVGVLKMVADIHQVTLKDSDIDELKSRMAEMPAHPDVAPALERLKQAGFRLVTLTNSPAGASPTPLEKAGISEAFEQHFSVGAVEQFKPAPATYQHVAEQLEVKLDDMCMVACHVWDTIGAQAAGMQGALLTRPHNAVLPASNVPTPDHVADELMTLADHLIATRHA
ncbi:haloacid dehalogenase type II [Cobetia marina]|uniref:haloacid dehalogenase type II n=2 Tax=Cobetia TaxID=204286 RepID=UPI000865C8F5|nr:MULTISPECIES: haloacid dehalogenase type II [Cobetia]AOM00969.1 haloacid dehalogenase, type II [Cobetia marina]AZV32613.1 haloacid dehalogenase type II [Cobetia sp. ICG0124]MDO6786157.1 haloacid dehalogenase type II [Cobetia marina]TKD62710.1 haloacid dehalogenase type II [Cobetia marina]GED41820.1 haloacid dehalogenase [Cobetia marina]